MNPDEVRSAITLCRAAGLKTLYDLCVDIIIRKTDRSKLCTSRTFVHRKRIPDETNDIESAQMKLYRLGIAALKQHHRFYDVEKLYEEAIYLNRMLTHGVTCSFLCLSEALFAQVRWTDAALKANETNA